MEKKELEEILLAYLEKTFKEDFDLDSQEDLKPDPRAGNLKYSYWTHHRPDVLNKKYETYEEFKEEFVNRVGRFGSSNFLGSNSKLYWDCVIEEADKCIKNGESSGVSLQPFLAVTLIGMLQRSSGVRLGPTW